ncbi:MAG: polysaccharide biosynthesis tyrosine autokinase [Oscillatoriales cyanobacterium SM2_3_0]|nr:polysaccharide biosynthesis tyrosine autokinase [Oscillatoriales cyanobacterium SM2_3_0]
MDTENTNPLSVYAAPTPTIVPTYPLNGHGIRLAATPTNSKTFKPQVLSQFWRGLWRRSILVLGITTATTAAAYNWTTYQIPEYEGSFQLFMEPSQSQKNLLESADQPLETITPVASEIDVQSQIKLLESPKVMTGILSQIQTRYPEVQYSSLFNQTLQQTRFEPDKLSVELIPDTQILKVSYRDPDPEKIEFVLGQVAQGYLNYSVQNAQVVSLTQERIKRIEQQMNPLQARIPGIRREMLNLQQKYIFVDPEIRTRQLTEQWSQVQAEQLETQAQLQQAQAQYALLQEQLGLNPEQAMLASALTQSPRYQSLLEKLLDVETNIAIESTRFTEKAPQIQTLLDQRQQLLPLLQQEARQVLGQDIATVNPEILKFQDSVRTKLTENLITTANTIQMLEIRDQVLARGAEQLDQEIQAFPAIAQQYTTLERELESASQRLTDLTLKGQELALEVEPKPQKPWELIAAPTIPQTQQGQLIAVSPHWPVNLALGGLAGLGLGILAAQLLERSNNVFHTADEVTESVPLPLLGVIPASDEALMLPAAIAPQLTSQLTQAQTSLIPCSPFQESFRSLNTNLKLMAAEAPIRACVISSAMPSDGKSTVALNWSKGAAAMGQKVLLVDADLRYPKLHKVLGLNNQVGLGELVVDPTLDPSEVIQPSNLDQNLWILTAGQMAADPTRLLASVAMQELMQKFYEMFDLIVYDTAPLLGLADANLLAPHTNGLMIVIGVGKTDRQAVGLALRELQMAGVPVLGMIANGDKRESQYYAYS